MHRFIIMRCQCVEEEDCRPLFSQTFSWHVPSAEKCEQCLLRRQHNLFKHFWTQRTECRFSKGWSAEIPIDFTNRNIKHKIYMTMEKKKEEYSVFQSNMKNLILFSTLHSHFFRCTAVIPSKPRRPQMLQRL